jgi:hypothetical protein
MSGASRLRDARACQLLPPNSEIALCCEGCRGGGCGGCGVWVSGRSTGNPVDAVGASRCTRTTRGFVFFGGGVCARAAAPGLRVAPAEVPGVALFDGLASGASRSPLGATAT